MTDVLRRFAVVGLLATAADVALLVLLTGPMGVPALLAGAVSILVAAAASYSLHRAVTFAHDPQRRFVDEPLAYLGVTAVAGMVDLAVFGVGVAVISTARLPDLLAAKAVALAFAGAVRLAGYRRVLLRSVRTDQSVRVDRGPAPGESRLSVVIPAFRCESTIAATVDAVRAGLADVAADGGLEIVVVDDGSPDATAAEADRAGADTVVRLDGNRGKGAAVRAGCMAARGRTIVFTDDDLSYGAPDLRRVLDGVESGWDVVVGSRRHIETTTLVRARRLREITGRLFNLLTTAVLLGQYRDTQCGLKGFRGDVARLLFERGRIDRFAFDVELFHLAERYRLSLLEIPVELSSAAGSRVRLGPDSWRMVADLFRIRRMARRGVYGPDPETARAWIDSRRTAPGNSATGL